MEKNQKNSLLYGLVIKKLLKEYTTKDISAFCYRELYDVCKLFGVVYVSQLWDITEEVEKKHGIIMDRVRVRINNIE